ncbi:presqualene diphosphate synthase HpnD [Thiohalophilus sp.]|uniref:presqualene diphosphate synthase HpnD n=1 Tax=Thiohalophilus sp. TaxID=3028392 RepID=UPI002ACDC75B|nr:presqualene diphosphate synthase HpnD [Thiohalophilus sp.]MDZ7662750.1 presqualene diphosphate synthase HpnD [Thiohalophilus sp.]
MTPEQYCQDKTAASGSSFYYSFLFLPRHRRRAITALYAFCREVDDVVDADSMPEIRRVKLQWWRSEVERLYSGQAQHPVTRALQPAIRDFDLAQEYFMEIIDGMEMDLEQQRYATFRELSLYCCRVASVVGLLSAEIFGYRDRRTLKYARDLGMAFQLTNILRDVGEDARRGRIYLPQEDLQQFGVSEADLLQGRESPGFYQLMAFEARRARDYYQRAHDHLPAIDRPAQRAGLIMSAIYAGLLDELEKDGFHVLTRRLSLTAFAKLWLAGKTVWREKRRSRHHPGTDMD